MLPFTLYYFITVAASLSVILFIIYYFFRLHAMEKEFETKTKKTDTEYHKIVDNALSKERKILDDAAEEADKILTDANYINTATKESLDKALQSLVKEFEKESNESGRNIMLTYQNSLKEVTDASLKNFDTISKELEADLQKQIKAFNETLLTNMQKTIDEYKETQLKLTREKVGKIVAQVSEEVLNKTISIEDHQKLVIESFEKAKKDNLFN